MLPLVPYGIMLRKVIGPLPEQELAHAHAVARRLKGELGSVGMRFWLVQGVQSVMATAIALLGHLLLGWSALWILAALALDLLATLVGDWLKQQLAPDAAAAEMERALESEAVLDTIDALRKPRRWPQELDSWTPATREVLRVWTHARSGPSRYVFHGSDRHRDMLEATRSVLREVAIFVVALCALAVMLLAVDARLPDPWTPLLLILAAGMRIAEAVRIARRAEASPEAPHPQLLPGSLPACAALHLACLLTVAIVQFLAPGFGREIEEWALGSAGRILIALHFLFTLGQLWLWRQRVRRASAAVAAFAGRDPEQLREQWRRVNG